MQPRMLQCPMMQYGLEELKDIPHILWHCYWWWLWFGYSHSQSQSGPFSGGTPFQWGILDHIMIMGLAKASLSVWPFMNDHQQPYRIISIHWSSLLITDHQHSRWITSTHHGWSAFIMDDQHSSCMITIHHGRSVVIMDDQYSSWIISSGSWVCIMDRQYAWTGYIHETRIDGTSMAMDCVTRLTNQDIDNDYGIPV